MYTQSQRREFMNREEVEEVEVEEEEDEGEEEDNGYGQENGVEEKKNRREEPAPLFESVPRPALRGVQARAPTRGGKQTKLYRRKITSR